MSLAELPNLGQIWGSLSWSLVPEKERGFKEKAQVSGLQSQFLYFPSLYCKSLIAYLEFQTH